MEWMPIDTANKKDCILGYGNSIDGPIMTVIFYLDLPKKCFANPDQWKPPAWVDAHCGKIFHWTHWMPLPQPPEEQK